jgi:hypothetical protein
MSTTTRCLFAVGLSVSLFAACGDDDDDGFGGGSGGRAGGGGSAGRAGAAGAAGASGAAGNGGDAGSGGSGGSGTGGTGGSTAGTGGSTAGTGGSGEDPGDAGPDATADGGDVVPPGDGGVEPIACPDLEDAFDDADTSSNSNVIIARVVFEGGNAIVTFKAVGGDFNFAPPLQLCTGSEPADCDDAVQDLEGSGSGDAGAGDLLEGEEVEITTPLGDIVSAASGELALVNGLPNQEPDEPIIFAYINWGDYVSLAPTTGDNDDLATEADEEGVWDADSSIDVDGQTTIVADSDVTDENGFSVCTQP